MKDKPRPKRTYSEEFKKHIYELSKSGLRRKEIIAKYSLTPSAFDRWIQHYRQEEEVEEFEAMTDDQKKILLLKQRNKELEMENDILKQAALILARKKDMS